MTDIEKMQVHAQEAAELLKLMAHPARLMVLCQLAGGEVGVSRLQRHSDLSQSAFSQHLKVLREHGLVVVRKSSQQVFYSLADHRATAIISSLQQLFCHE
ncbi:ArsR/SmtB family transcription factor [Vibrio quintilis]|uniref:Biofilm growth-associated repressor n=1 Tax=Vibrio quintilis TaxID=1117707 RepID=A0A1M7Z1I8_9VIBR|nr:metalloregulator ArsR/SmtB family transcription factor [Vibrio quintilis]SHO58733.1 Biofilm growth-associated repressor [Vibrio quintilis]